jgi:hypothetical protein
MLACLARTQLRFDFVLLLSITAELQCWIRPESLAK